MIRALARAARRPQPRASAIAFSIALSSLCLVGPYALARTTDGDAADMRVDATVRHVDDDAGCSGLSPCYSTIGAAAAAAGSGDVIRIAAGRYPESVVVVDKALRFEGPGADGADPAAVWAPPAGSAYALLVDARSADITQTVVSGLRFQGGDTGVYLSGRRPGSPLGPPPGRPGGPASTDIAIATVLDSRFEGQADAAIVIRWADEARVEQVRATGTGVDAVRVIDGLRFSMLNSSLAGAGACLRFVETRPSGSRGEVPQVGGARERSNDFSGCAAAALVLEDRSGDGAGPTDVAAAFNRWGSAWETGIEERIRDMSDVPNVGRVFWRPAIDAPSEVAVVITPTALVADGVSRAQVEARVVDGAGRPVEDGVVVSITSDAGRLDRSGARSEVEGPAVVSSGEWGLFTSPTFGAFEGAGYVRSDQVGATLAWTFDAPAVVARFGTQPIDEAIVQVQVDDRTPETVSLFGAELRWVEHRLASGLGPGPHTMTVTVVAGTVAVDAFGAGWPSVGGVVRAELVAPATTGIASLRADAWGAGGRVGADRALELIPGPPSAMSVSVGSDTLGAGGATTDVVVRASDALGRPVRDGTSVTISATLGAVDPAVTVFVGGLANTVFTSGAGLGDGRITASAEGVSGPISATAAMRIVPGPPASIALEVDRESMTANGRDSALISARVADTLGNPVPDGTPIGLTSSLGSIEAYGGVTVGGVVSAVLRAGSVAGTAELVARDPSGSAPAARGEVELVAPDLWVTKRVEPVGVVVPGEVVTFTVTYGNRGPGSVYDVVLDELMPEGIVSPSLSVTGPTLGVRDGRPYIFDIERIRSGRSGEIQVRGRIDPARRWNRTTLVNTARLTAPTAAEATPDDNAAETALTIEPSAVYTVTLAAPVSLPVGGATGVLSVRVFDRFGNNALNGTPVSFATDLGSIEPALVTTVSGRASATFTSGTESGVAMVRVLSLDDRGDSKRIVISPGPASAMALTTSHPRLPVAGGRAELTASIADQFGNPVSDTLVIFSTDLGSVAPGAAATSQDGIVTSTLLAGTRAGTASVESRVGTLARGLRIPFDPGAPERLEILRPPRPLELGRSSLVSARVSDIHGNPIEGADVSFAFDLGVVVPPNATTRTDGIARTAARPFAVGTGRILALSGALDNSLSVDVLRPTLLLPYTLRSGGR